MLLVTLALVTAQPSTAQPSTAQPITADRFAPVRAAQAPCNPDALKSIACAVQRHTPSPRRVPVVPLACNPDPLKGAACHAHAAQVRAEARSQSPREAELAAAD